MQVSPAGQSDDRARFLAEFRALRDRAVIDYEELAARTHFPSNVLKDAEKGPGLPGLPVLAAYVRACGGDVAEWEERWRQLARLADDEPGLPTRSAGNSAAAVAGARAGVTAGPADAADTERIKAAIRAHQQREEHENRARRPVTMVANGTHHKEPPAETFDSSVASAAAAASVGSPATVGAAEGFQAFGGTTKASTAASGRTSAGPAGSTAGRERNTASSPRVAAKVPAPSRNLTSRPGLLAAIVVIVLVVCVAALVLT